MKIRTQTHTKGRPCEGTQKENGHLQTMTSEETNPTNTFISDFEPLELRENTFAVFKPPNL